MILNYFLFSKGPLSLLVRTIQLLDLIYEIYLRQLRRVFHQRNDESYFMIRNTVNIRKKELKYRRKGSKFNIEGSVFTRHKTVVL